MIVIGIDPGTTGAIACVDSRGTCAVEDLPVTQLGGQGRTQRKLDGRALADLIHRFVPACDGWQVVLEDVHAMPAAKSGGAANTSLLHSKGVIEGVLGVLRMEPHLVDSRRWKGFYGLGKDKGQALQKARTLYPAVQHRLARQKDHNRAEALLLAHYGLRKLA
jgi:hypothetical protein